MRDALKTAGAMVLIVLIILAGLALVAMATVPIYWYIVRPYFEWCCS